MPRARFHHVSTPELKKYMKEAGERSWSLFTDPNGKQYVVPMPGNPRKRGQEFRE